MIKVILLIDCADEHDRKLLRFAGSVCTADRLIRTMITIGGCTLEQAVQMASLNPARVMGVADRKGSLEAGKDADIVIFGDNVEVFATIVSGRKVYQK